MQKTTSRTRLLRNDLARLNELKGEYKNAPILNKIEREIALYDIISIVEAMPITVREKAELAGISERKYQYSRRIIRDYPTREDLLEAMSNGKSISIINYRTKKVFKPDDFAKGLSSLMRKYEITYATPEFVTVVMRMYNRVRKENVLLETPIQQRVRSGTHPCICCGHVGDTWWTVKHEGTYYPVCRECDKGGKKPEDKDVIRYQQMYIEDLYKAHMDLLETI